MSTRRFFLRGALALTAVAVAKPALAAFVPPPRIYGDGVHDDAPGIQAMFDGAPFLVDGVAITAGGGRLEGGVFALGSTVRIENIFFVVEHNHFYALPQLDGVCMFHISGEASGSFSYNVFRLSAPPIAWRHILLPALPSPAASPQLGTGR